MQLTRCPECDGPAEIERREVLESTAGPMEHVKIRCVRRHWCYVPVACLDGVRAAVPRRTTVHHRR
jgi:hypothetical protein